MTSANDICSREHCGHPRSDHYDMGPDRSGCNAITDNGWQWHGCHCDGFVLTRAPMSESIIRPHAYQSAGKVSVCRLCLAPESHPAHEQYRAGIEGDKDAQLPATTAEFTARVRGILDRP